jgi:hypothetical protein
LLWVVVGLMISQEVYAAFGEHLEDAAEVRLARIFTAGMASIRRIGAMDAVERGT